ncbi:hypothetical protein ACTWP4_17070 [Gracilibacillus sp. D59]
MLKQMLTYALWVKAQYSAGAFPSRLYKLESKKAIQRRIFIGSQFVLPVPLRMDDGFGNTAGNIPISRLAVD